MKFLCICRAGMTRSVACANALKARGQNAVPTGWVVNAPEPIGTLSRWADRIVLMYNFKPDVVPASERRKIRLLDVGNDVWGDPTNPELVAIVDGAVGEWEARGYP